jgi:rare lipoprotein A
LATTVAGPVEATAQSQETPRPHEAHVAATPVTEPTASTAGPTEAATPPTTPAPDTEDEGQVTYYEHPAGTCASPWLPFGTVVRITNPGNGASVSCVVDDREADTARAIDLATSTFADIAPLSQGVIDARLTW